MATTGSSYRFHRAIVRAPGRSVANGLRVGDGQDPEYDGFMDQHVAYVQALRDADVAVTELAPLEDFPDSVFVEDAALCLGSTAIALRPGAPSRFGETKALRPELERALPSVVDLPVGHVDGGDVLVTDTEVLIGQSKRTDQVGFEALADIATGLGYTARMVETPPEILHFKTDCGLLDSETIFSTTALAATGCFADYRVIEAPTGEEAAANLIRVNDVVFVAQGHPQTSALLTNAGYNVVELDISQAACVDGGLSCMSLRFSISHYPG